MSRRLPTIVAGACLLGALAVLAGRPLLVRDPDPQIHVRWREAVGADARAALERRFGLQPVQQVAPDTWRYELADATRANIEALVRNADAADTHFIDRETFQVQPDAAPGVRRPGRLGAAWPALAFHAADAGPWALAAIALAAALAAAWPGRTRALAVGARDVLTRGVPVLSPRALGAFRLILGAALALYVSSQPFENLRTPPDALRADAPLVDTPAVHWLANHPSVVRAGQAVAVAGFAIFAFGVAPRLAYLVAVLATVQWLLALTLRTGSHPFGVLLWPLVGLLAVPWGAASDGAAARRYGYAPWLLALALGVAFAGAAWSKVREGPGWVMNGTVRYHFVTDFPQARVDWGLSIATMPRAAVALSAAAVLVEALTIAAAFVRAPAVRLVVGLAAMGLLIGFYLFQGLLWPAWWILLLGFLPWQWFDRPGRAAAPVPVSSPPAVSLAQVAFVVVLLAQQAAISAVYEEAEPFSSRYDMYAKTHRSAADYDLENPGIERRVLEVHGDGRTRDVTDCVARFDQPALEAILAFDPAAAAPSTAPLAPCRPAGERPEEYVLIESRCGFDWNAGRFSCAYRDRKVATLAVAD